MKWLEAKNMAVSEKIQVEKAMESIRQAQQSTLYHRIQQQKCGKHISQRKIAQKYEELKLKAPGKTVSQNNMPAKPGFGRCLSARKAKPCSEFAEQDKIVSSTFYGRIPLKEYRAKIHPPSKLVLTNKEQMNEKILTMKADEHLVKSEIEKAYKMSVMKDQKLIDQDKFVATYSTGPFGKQVPVSYS